MDWPDSLPPPWPHQEFARNEFWKHYSAGDRRICITSPTGGGKSNITSALILDAAKAGMRVSFYVHRKMLLEQTAKVFTRNGIRFGIRASGYEPDLGAPIQISSIQTENARAIKKVTWGIHQADLVIMDEVHAYRGSMTKKVIEAHGFESPSFCLNGFTATPVDIWQIYKSLIVAGRNSDLRACGAHLWCKQFHCGEPDLEGLNRSAIGEYVEGEIEKRIMVPTIFGRVYDNWKLYNPQARPAILFAPSVKASYYFVDDFIKRGVPAAHIDGEYIYYGEKDAEGKNVCIPSKSRDEREKLLDKLRDGTIKVLCNRFVLTEGIDLPELYHCILATSFGSVATYLQAVGRLLRAHPSLDHKVLCDHGGNLNRHLSANMDRDWKVGDSWEDFKFNESTGELSERYKDEPQPIVCPKCGSMRLSGPRCYECGFVGSKSGIHVVQLDGTLRPYVEKPKKEPSQPKHPLIKLWDSVYYRCRNSRNPNGMSYNKVLSMFKHQTGVPVAVINNQFCIVDRGQVIPLPGMPSADNKVRLAQRVNQKRIRS